MPPIVIKPPQRVVLEPQHFTTGKALNSQILSKVRAGTMVDPIILGEQAAIHLKEVLGSSHLAASRISAFRVRDDLHSRVDQLAARFPDPMSHEVITIDALRAVAPQEVLDKVGITPTSSPPPTIALIGPGNDAHTEYDGLKIRASDMVGIKTLRVNCQIYELDEHDQPVYYADGKSRRCYLPSFHSISTESSPPPLAVCWGGNIGLTYGDLEVAVEAVNQLQQSTKYVFQHRTVKPHNPATSPSSPSPSFSPGVEGYARQHNLDAVMVQKLYEGGSVVKNGKWSATWYGSIEVELTPNECSKLSLAMFVTFGITLLVDVIAAIEGAAWPALLILVFIAMQMAEIASVMKTCSDQNKPGRIGFNIPTGLFYAYC